MIQEKLKTKKNMTPEAYLQAYLDLIDLDTPQKIVELLNQTARKLTTEKQKQEWNLFQQEILKEQYQFAYNRAAIQWQINTECQSMTKLIPNAIWLKIGGQLHKPQTNSKKVKLGEEIQFFVEAKNKLAQMVSNQDITLETKTGLTAIQKDFEEITRQTLNLIRNEAKETHE